MFKSVTSSVVAVLIAVSLLIAALIATSDWAMRTMRDSFDETSATIQRIAGPEMELAIRLKDIQIATIQVQQFLSDVSATRGLDGLDDGFEKAAENARAFSEHMAGAEALARKLELGEVIRALGTVRAAFEPFYAEGRKMAEAYVKDGPAGGNAMMVRFDAAAERMYSELQSLLDVTREVLKRDHDRLERVIAQTATVESRARVLVFGFAAGALLVLIFIAVFLFRSVIRPLASATAITRRLAEGQMDVDIPTISRLRELRELREGLCVFRQNAALQAAASAAVAGAPLATLVLDDDGGVVIANRAFDEFWSHHAGALSALTAAAASDGKHPNFRPLLDRVAKAWQDSRQLAKQHGVPALELREGGRILEVIPNEVLARDGTRIGTALRIEDVTAVRQLEAEFLDIIGEVGRGEFKGRVTAIDDLGFTSVAAHGLNQLMDAVESFIDGLQTALRAIAHNDLTVEMKGEFQGGFAALQRDFNTTVGVLHGLVEEVAAAARQVEAESAPIAEGGRSLAARTEAQAAAIEQTSATMIELSEGLKKSAELSSEAGQNSADATAHAERGGQAVGETIEAVTRIAESSDKIAEIISVIDSIAFQTNLLALNAAVEAARAGEAGKGFAVVASEVRDLAQRSSDAAREIRSLIDESSAHVRSGVDLVNQTGETLGSLVEMVRSVATAAGNIASATADQAAGVGQVQSAVQELDETTQQNARLADANAQSADRMRQAAERLSELVSKFRIRAHALASQTRAA
ncbi:MAG: hypothetical protein D6754_13140 [Alphaproteobacteria bacterium]|nr:MAG: hypothetical protein D6754_13140 [Alphaproteobacteria bacterium]